MRKHLLFAFLFIAALFNAKAQYGFEWIEKDAPALKFPIPSNGVFQIDSVSFARAGLNPLDWPIPDLRLFRNGREHAFYVSNPQDSFVRAGQSLVFLGFANDGKLDQELYRQAQEQPHTQKSLFSDTAWYFLVRSSTTASNPPKRYQETILPAGSLGQETQVLKQLWFCPQEEYYRGANLPASERYYLSDYGDAEGWISYLISQGQSRIYPFSLQNPVQAGMAKLQIKLIGSSDFFLPDPNLPNHHVRIFAGNQQNNLTLVADTTYRGYGERLVSVTIPASMLGPDFFVRFDVVNDLGVTSDLNGISYIHLEYLSQNFSGAFLQNQVSSTRKMYQGLISGSLPFILDTSSQKLFRSSTQGLNWQLVVESNLSSSLYLAKSEEIIPVSNLSRVTFGLIDPNEAYSYLIVSSRQLSQSAETYRNYRSASYKTLLVFAEDLANTFFYGHHHPLAIRRFVKYLYQNQSAKPQYLLLLGRGYQNSLLRLTPENYARNLVPAIGEPSSDNMFSTGFDNDKGVPALATGRIPASTNAEVLNYLNKLIRIENEDSIAFWRKQYLHISGGEDYFSEQLPFKNQVNSMENIIKRAPTGAFVSSFHKNITAPTQDNIREKLIAIQNNGISMLTFLGHGSLTVLDMDFGSIGNLQASQKPAFYYFNGCNIGNANDVDPGGTGLVYGKDFLCAANKGAIGWLAHSNLTLTNNLFSQMNSFYTAINGLHYGKGVGRIIQEALLQSTATGDLYARSHALQLLLQGDPAFKLYSPALSDFLLNSNSAFIFPESATAQSDSFALAIVVDNAGKAISDSIEVSITRTLPDNSQITFPEFKIPSPLYRDTVYYWVKDVKEQHTGINRFQIRLNPNQLVNEANFSNNNLSFEYFLKGTGIRLLFPPPFAMHSGDSVKLWVQNNNLFSGQQAYLFEVDTTPLFNSPLLKKSEKITGAALASFSIVQRQSDTTIWFWRARMDLPSNQGGDWQNSSFTWIPNADRGFRQAGYNQTKQISASRFIVLNDSNKTWEFTDNELILGIENRRWDHRRMGVTIPYLLNALVGNCISQGTVALIFEPFQVDMPYELPNYPFNCSFIQANKGDRSLRYYPFNTNFADGETELKRLIDSVPDGYFVALFSRYSSNVNNWLPATKSIFPTIGSTVVSQVKSPNTAWAVIGVKGGALGTATEDTVINNELEGLVSLPPAADQPQDEKYLRIRKSFLLKWFEGDFTTSPAGPAKAWKTLEFVKEDGENPPSGRSWVSLLVTNKQGKDSVVISNLSASKLDISFIDASIYPYVKLKLSSVDSSSRTPTYFKSWAVHYAPSAELAWDPASVNEWKGEQIQQGDSLSWRIGLRNVSPFATDSIFIQSSLANANRIQVQQNKSTITPIEADGVVPVSIKLDSRISSGKHSVEVIANPNNNPVESNFNNNIAQRQVDILADRQNPLLDIRFDGQRIVNGELVSPSPRIRITSKDNNAFLLQKDTSTFTLWLRKPREFDYLPINLNSPEVSFFPAEEKSNEAALEYKPSRLADGLYTLRVQAKDASGNAAGNTEYQVDFNVLGKSTITHFYPYPNPFTTQMRFVFTLTGEFIPDQLLIRIMTVDGRVVKEVTKEEFGNIRIGNNISEWFWDGRDQFGDPLANGVYLYQVLTRLKGNELEHRTAKSSGEEGLFTNGVGKIYLMR